MMILVTGGTGFVGRHLIRRLTEEGHSIRCLVRQSSKKVDLLKEFDLEIVNGDVTDLDSVKRAAEGCDAVYSLVGLLYEPRGYTFDSVHAGGVRNIVEACRASGIKRLLHISALGTSPEAKSRYHRTKLTGEEVIKESGLDYTVFRPSVIFGEDDSFVNLFAPMIRLSPVIGIIGDGGYRMQPVYIEDLITCMVKSLNDEKTYEHVYEIGGGEALTFNEIIDSIASAMGKKRLKLQIPVTIARPMARLMELLPRPPLTIDQLIMLLSDNICDNREAEKIFGVEFVKFSEGIKNFLGG